MIGGFNLLKIALIQPKVTNILHAMVSASYLEPILITCSSRQQSINYSYNFFSFYCRHAFLKIPYDSRNFWFDYSSFMRAFKMIGMPV